MAARKRYAKAINNPHDVMQAKKARGPIPTISFSEEDLEGVQLPHDDALVITALVANREVHRILVDNGSSTDIIFNQAFQKMGIPLTQLTPSNATVTGLSGEPVRPIGHWATTLRVGSGDCQKEVCLNFCILDIPASYNMILGRSGLHALEAVVSTLHLAMKFPTPGGIGVVKGNQKMSRTCYLASCKGNSNLEGMESDILDPRMNPIVPKPEANDEVVAHQLIEGNPNRMIKIGAEIEPNLRNSILAMIRRNADIFAWSASDVPGIARDVIVHQLKCRPEVPPIKQRKRTMSLERQAAVRAEVQKLLDANFIREIQFTQWLSNVVLVPKPGGNWRICIDYTNLNKACPKDDQPLPRIDQMVDATAGHELLSFMDAYSGYNQIHMLRSDEHKTAFITDSGVYCYTRMPFGLKNAGATFQRLINTVFSSQIGRNAEAYVDDILTKSVHAIDHPKDLEETFASLRRYAVKLNPAKCVFGVRAGKFLGFLISQRGIEVNPEKIDAIQKMKAPASFKDVMILNGRLAALSRFIARAAERSLPFFKIL